MKTETIKLWEHIPGEETEVPEITAYIPESKKSDAAIVILPGGGYNHRAPHEGEGYAKFFAENGITAFSVKYRVAPAHFPIPLLDARRSVKFARFFANKYCIDKNKIAIMGSSAGGHLAALCSTYTKDIDFDIEKDEIEKEDFLPNAQILCYPVVELLAPIGHEGSGKNLLGEGITKEQSDSLCPALIAKEGVPQAFIWHTFEDGVVNVINSLRYAEKLREVGGSAEMHIYPHGHHGMGLSKDGTDKVREHVSAWSGCLLKWLKYIGY